VVAARDGVRYAVETKPGLDFARNSALGLATTDFIAYFDDDIVSDPGWLNGFRDALAAHPDAGGVTGLVLPLALDTPAQVLFERRGGFRRGHLRRRIGLARPDDPIHPAGSGAFGTGSNMAFRRMLLHELGGFDEALDTGASLPGGGDLDMFYRVARSGRTLVYEPGCTVFHEHRRTLAELERQYWTSGLGVGAYMGKWLVADRDSRRRFRRLALRWAKDLLQQWVRALTGRHPTPSSLLLKELFGGVRGLLGEYGRARRRIDAMRSAGP
jgi:glycosyltransferase involved in cell wall biosynthesis